MCTFSHFVIFPEIGDIMYIIYILTKTAYSRKDRYFMVRSISLI